jgi:N,N'-diacetyllegionaminate synthase
MIIAEIAQSHDGSLGMAHSFIDALKDSGVDVVKFQTHIAAAESSAFEPFRIAFSYEDATRFDYWQRMEFTPEQWAGLKEHCEQAGMQFLSSPFSIAAVELLEQIGVKWYKIGSGEVSNLLMMERIARTGKPVMISSGMSSYEELDAALEVFAPHHSELSIFQCTTAYPTSPENWGLDVIARLKSRYGLPIGFSDHSGDIYACLAATALGADLVEFHVVFDKKQFGPDTKASITMSQAKQLATGVRQIRASLAHPVDKTANNEYAQLKVIFGKSLAVNKSVSPGHIVQLSDLEAKKPGNRGIPANEFRKIIGKVITKQMEPYEFLQYQYVEQ